MISATVLRGAGHPTTMLHRVTALGIFAGVVLFGCLSRDVGVDAPKTKSTIDDRRKVSPVTKIDLLFAIDNSQSMGDKQTLLARAVPDLVERLLDPNCLDQNGRVTGRATINGDGDAACANGEPEFRPVEDLHIGVVTSSLGGMGSASCGAELPVGEHKRIDATLNAHNDDRGHLVNRAGASEAPVASMGASNYLAWLPNIPRNQGAEAPRGTTRITERATLMSAFQSMIEGVHEYGCGFEAQLEATYRFLVQPDPFDHVVVKDGQAAFEGVDEVLLRQRADFLRPDSIVLVVMLTDEDHSSPDPRAMNGVGWEFARTDVTMPRPSPPCASSPGDAACGSCRNLSIFAQFPECRAGKAFVRLSPEEDPIGVRFSRMKERFGIDPRYPIQRYVDGFRSTKVPSREEEHSRTGPDYADYRSAGTCTNPLFAAGPLPTSAKDDLCRLPEGSRSPRQIFFALIGGVPWQLLTDQASDPEHASASAKFLSKLSDADWLRILGKDPAHYDETGMSPYLRVSATPRPALASGSAIHTREWDTRGDDLQYACTFDLPADLVKDCTSPDDPACPCGVNAAADVNRRTDNPVCDPTHPTRQTKAKAYPTTSELRVAHALGEQGIVASICPREVSDAQSADFGYRPAMGRIVDQLKTQIGRLCLPRPIESSENGAVACVVIEQLGETGGSDLCAKFGREVPPQELAASYRREQRARLGDLGADEALQHPLCVLPRIPKEEWGGATCATSTRPGWCYVTREETSLSVCDYAVQYSRESEKLAKGSTLELRCFEANQ